MIDLIINFFLLFVPVFYGMPLIMVTTSVVVILVQQRASLEKIRQLNGALLDSPRKGLTHQQKVYRLKRSFNRLAFTTVHLSGTVAAYSRQWSAYLSTIVPVQVLSISNLSFILFFAGDISITLKYMFLFADLALTVLLFAQMNSCAQVVRHQGAFAKQCSAFTRRLAQLGQLSSAEQLKYEVLVINKKFAFAFLDDSAIKPSTFPLVNK